MNVDRGHSILSRVVSSDAISAGRHDGRPRRKKATLQAAINPRNRSLPQRNQPHRETTTLNSRENIFRREPAYVSAAPFQFPRGSRPPLHEGKYLPETDTTCGKQYALGGIQ